MNRRSLPFAFALVASCLACGGGGSDAGRPELTERQRDSILARSSIPGAPAVGKAMRVADSTSARIHASDTVTP